MIGFENWATSPRSVVEMDPALAFETPLLTEALAVWSAQAGDDVPPRSVFTARTAKGFLGNLVIFERQGTTGYFIRLMGTRVTCVIGEMQGKQVGKAVPPAVAQRWTEVLDGVLASLRPLRVVSRVGFSNLDFLQAEILLAPLRDGDGKPTMVFAVVTFRAGVAAADAITVEDEAGALHEEKER